MNDDSFDDENDICLQFERMMNNNFDNSNYICYKYITECGDINIIVNDQNGNEKINILYSLTNIEPFDRHVISSFYYDGSIGILEKTFLDYTEYFINGQYYGNQMTYEIENLINEITRLILDYKIFPNLYNFIMGDDEIIMLPISEFDNNTIRNMFLFL